MLETPADALVMETINDRSVAGWNEIGRVSTIDGDTKYGEMRHLQAIGDQLVAIGSSTGKDGGPIEDVIYHSVDGVSWFPAVVPGNKPKVADMAAASDGIIAAGSDEVDGANVARVWSSPDGIEWTQILRPD